MNEENTIQLLKDMAEGKELKPGPQIPNLRDCEGPEGQTTLLDTSKLTFPCRDFDALKKELDEKAKASEDQ